MDDLAKKSHTWTGPNAVDSTDRTYTSSSRSIHHDKEHDSLKAQVELLTKQIEALIAEDSKTMHSVAQLESQECPVYGEMRDVNEENYNTLGMYQKPYTPYTDTYNPSWRNHPNDSCR